MRHYTIEEIEKLFKIRLKGFDPKESYDDLYTNEHDNFDYNCSDFIEWLKKMESQNKIEHLLKNE